MKYIMSFIAAAVIVTPAVQAQQGPVEIKEPVTEEKAVDKKSSGDSVDVDAAAKRVDSRLKKDAKTLKNFFGIGGKDKKADEKTKKDSGEE